MNLLGLVNKYRDRLIAGGYKPYRHFTGAVAVLLSPQLSHVMWMLDEMIGWDYSQWGNEDKAWRWLCFVQGVLWSHGFYTVDDFRDDNAAILNPEKAITALVTKLEEGHPPIQVEAPSMIVDALKRPGITGMGK